MIRVGQSNILDLLIRPILLKRPLIIRSNRNDLRSTFSEIGVIVAHTRQLRAAVGSRKAAQKRKYNGLVSAKIGKSYNVSVYIFKFKIRGEFAWGN